MGVGPPLYNQRGRPGLQPQWSNPVVEYPPRKIQNINPYAYEVVLVMDSSIFEYLGDVKVRGFTGFNCGRN